MKSDENYDKHFYIAGLTLIVIIIIGYIAISKLGTWWIRLLPKCYFNLKTGYYCPGCGGTRAVIALFKGRILKSLFYHPIVLYTVVIGGWFMLSQTIEIVSEKLFKHRIRIGMHYRNRYLWVALVIVVVNFVIKNGLIFLTGQAIMD